MLGTYKLKHTLYPSDDTLLTDKEEWDRDLGDSYRKGTIWVIVTKEEFCELENYDENDTEDFMEEFCDFELVAFMKNKPGRYMYLNSLEDFIKI